MDFELIINPTNEEHHPDRYKAVLLLNDGISKGYPTSMTLEEILKSVSKEVGAYAEGMVKLTYKTITTT